MSFKRKIILLIIFPCIAVATIIGIIAINQLDNYSKDMRATTLESITTTMNLYIGNGTFHEKDNITYFGKHSMGSIMDNTRA